MELRTRVLVIDDEPTTLQQLASFLAASAFDVTTCGGLNEARDALHEMHPHVIVLVPSLDSERHDQLEHLRRICPRVPVVVVTAERSNDVLLDIEAFAPALPARPQRGLGHIAAAVCEASCG